MFNNVKAQNKMLYFYFFLLFVAYLPYEKISFYFALSPFLDIISWHYGPCVKIRLYFKQSQDQSNIFIERPSLYKSFTLHLVKSLPNENQLFKIYFISLINRRNYSCIIIQIYSKPCIMLIIVNTMLIAYFASM